MKEREDFIESIKEKGFICPEPNYWNEFYLKFNIVNILPKPLILAAWWHTSDQEKFIRFREQLNIIDNYQMGLDAIFFLNKLTISQWYKKQ